jgi:hypothetical protein
VSRARLREISTLGWIQEGAGGAGVFFSSGAFWLLATLVAEHWDETAKYTPWFILCGLSILFGVVLMWIGFRHFKMKQDYISDLFGDDDATPP